jgi:hypothetical protein
MTRRTPDPARPGRTGPTATGTATYEIRVAGHLDDHWAATLGDLGLVRLDDGTTSLTGPLDQAHLHGVLARIRDLGVPLLALRPLDRVGTAAQTTSETPPGRGCTALRSLGA